MGTHTKTGGEMGEPRARLAMDDQATGGAMGTDTMLTMAIPAAARRVAAASRILHGGVVQQASRPRVLQLMDVAWHVQM